MTTETRPQIVRYRQCPSIVAVNGRCQNDGIRVWPKRGGGFYHDPLEVRLASEEHAVTLAAQAKRVANWRERHDL